MNIQGTLIGSAKISALSESGLKQFYSGVLRDIKDFFKDKKNNAEYEEWLAKQKETASPPRQTVSNG